MSKRKTEKPEEQTPHGAFMNLVREAEAESPELARELGISSAAMDAGARIRRMRRQAGLSQSQLAEKLGISQARISEIESGEGVQGPTWLVMERVAEACGQRIEFVPTAQPATEPKPQPSAMDELLQYLITDSPVMNYTELYRGAVAGHRKGTPAILPIAAHSMDALNLTLTQSGATVIAFSGDSGTQTDTPVVAWTVDIKSPAIFADSKDHHLQLLCRPVGLFGSPDLLEKMKEAMQGHGADIGDVLVTKPR